MPTHSTASELAPKQAWRKSSYSDGTGNNCVEVAWIKSSYSDSGGQNCVEVAWIKSTFSDAGQNCVEVAHLTPGIGVRDSKNPTGPALLLPPTTWTAFITHLRDPQS